MFGSLCVFVSLVADVCVFSRVCVVVGLRVALCLVRCVFVCLRFGFCNCQLPRLVYAFVAFVYCPVWLSARSYD